SPSVAATAAPLWLGAIAAGLQAREIHKILGGDAEGSILGSERYYDLGTCAAVASRFVRNPGCLLDHAGGGGAPLGHVTIDEVFRAVPQATLVRALHRRFIRPLACSRCGAEAVRAWRFAIHPARYGERCHACGSALVATALDVADGISAVDAPAIGHRRL